MKINCDLGESFGVWHLGDDESIMPFVDQANIACGYHGGDPDIMVKTVSLAMKHNVSIGAHPSYPDRQGFGRRSMKMSQSEIKALLLYQIGALDGIVRSYGGCLEYVKPHGALYNDMMWNEHTRLAIFSAMACFHGDLPLMVQSTNEFSAFEDQAAEFGIQLLAEVFADRLYADNGTLTARTVQGSVHTFDKAVEQIKSLVTQGEVITDSGFGLALRADSICLHGDTSFAPALAVEARRIVATC